jgi:hypothetical protein
MLRQLRLSPKLYASAIARLRPSPVLASTLPIKYALSRIANRRNAVSMRLSKKKHLGSAA